MVGRLKLNRLMLPFLRSKNANKRTIVIGLKSDNSSREMLLRLLHFVVMPGDIVLAVHVQEPDDTFDPNTFHIHEDLCKSKQVDFQLKICTGKDYITELSHQVRVNLATILAIGCSSSWPKDSTVSNCLKMMPPTCSLLVMDKGGKILLQREGTSQQGSTAKSTSTITAVPPPTINKVLQSSRSALLESGHSSTSDAKGQIRKSLTMPCCLSSSSFPQSEDRGFPSFKKNLHHVDVMPRRVFQKLATLEIKGYSRRFTLEYLRRATNNFSPEMLIAEGGQSKVYRATLDDGQAAAVKVHNMSQDLLQEVEILSGLKQENVVQLLGYCYSREIKAVVYNLLENTLMAKLAQLKWGERMKVAVDVARALDYLHSCSPPIIHRDVKSSNILLADNCRPQLSDFGAAFVYEDKQQAPAFVEQNHVVGTFGYLAPEYVMYGKVDEKIDVYSYGVVLLELITGKEAIHSKPVSNHDSLVLWARSLLCSGLCRRIIDPNLGDDYDKDEMKTLMIAARLCLLHSASRRPTMKTILQLFEDPSQWLEMQRKREQLLDRIGSRELVITESTSDDDGDDDSESCETLVIDDS